MKAVLILDSGLSSSQNKYWHPLIVSSLENYYQHKKLKAEKIDIRGFRTTRFA